VLVQCQKCGGGVSDTATKCPKCAASPEDFLGSEVSCRECGGVYRPAYAECGHCGAQRSVALPPATSPPAVPPKPAPAKAPSLTTQPSAPVRKEKTKRAGAVTYVVTYIIANLLVNGVSGAVGTSIARGKSFQDIISWGTQLTIVCIGAVISIIGLAVVYGISRAATGMVPLKAFNWLIAGVVLGSLLTIGQVYGSFGAVVGVDEARSLATQMGLFTLAGGAVSLLGFWTIFRDQV
jgi:hypothetical protein